MNPPAMNPKPKPVTYICRDNGHENPQEVLNANRIECPDCGCRILFKKRPRKIVMHLAR